MSQEQQQSEAPAPAPAETTEQTPGAEANGSAPPAPSPAAAATASNGASDPPPAGGETTPESWKGELEALEKSEWYTALPEQHRALVRDGLKAKLSNFERGYQQKFQDVAKQRSHLDNEIRAERERIQNMLYGVDDPTKDVRAELARAVEDKTKLEAELAKFEAEQQEAKVDELLKWVEETNADVYKDDKAWTAFAKAYEAGIEREQAIKMAAVLIDKPSTKEVPDSINMMNTGSAASNTESKTQDDYDTVRRRLLAQG